LRHSEPSERLENTFKRLAAARGIREESTPPPDSRTLGAANSTEEGNLMDKSETFRMAVSLTEKLIDTKRIQTTSAKDAEKTVESYVSGIHAAIRRAWDKAQDEGA
jgi:hypothetical protein